MVRGLVQEEEVRRRHELAGETHPTGLAATQPLERLRARGGRVEAQALEHGVHTRFHLVPSLPAEPLEVAVVALEQHRRVRFVRIGQGMRLDLQVPLQLQEGREGPRRRLPHGGGRAEGALLVQHRDAQLSGAGCSTVRRPEGPGDHVEQGGLPRAVAPDDAPALAPGDREAHVFEDPRRAELDDDAGEGDLAHGCARWFMRERLGSSSMEAGS